MVDALQKRVLVWGLTNNRAGTEAAIVNYASRVDDVAFDFLCYEAPLVHWEKLDRSGNRYFVIPSKIKDPLGYTRAIRAFMKEHAREYDALWFNVNDAANVDPLKFAKSYGIPRRIVHMHSSDVANAPLTRFFHGLNKGKLVSLATDYRACSKAAASFLGAGSDTRIVPNVIDVDAVSFSAEKRADLRTELGLDEKRVVGTVGRLVDLKNPAFLLKLMPVLLELDPSIRLVFVGNGVLESELIEQSKTFGIEDKVVFAGQQEDIQAYLSAFDVYVQPSSFEGFGISVLEAQFNGLPCIVSDAVPREVDITTGIEHISLDDERAWVDAILAADRDQVERFERAARYDAKQIDSFAAEML